MHRLRERYNWYYCLIYAIPILALAFVLVYHYSVMREVFTWSDYSPHFLVVEDLLEGDLSPVGKRDPHLFFYPLFHITIALLSRVTGSIAWTAVIVIMLSLTLTILGVRKLALRQLTTPTSMQLYAVDFIAVTCVAIGAIAGPVTGGRYYIPYGSFNVWHNPTTTFMRPFAIYATYYFMELWDALPWDALPDAERRRELRRPALIFSILLFLSVLAKPSFALVFLIAAGLLTLARFLRRVGAQPRAAFRCAVTLLVCVLPSIALMLVQEVLCSKYGMLDFGLQLRPLSDIFSLSTLRGLAALYVAPLLFLVFGFKYIRKEPLCQLAYVMLGAGFFIWYCTVQGLPSMTDYAWSYYYTLFFGIVIAAVFSVKYVKKLWYRLCFAGVWGLQLFYGIKYMYYIEVGGKWF